MVRGIAILRPRSFKRLELYDRMIDAKPLNSSACERSEGSLESSWRCLEVLSFCLSQEGKSLNNMRNNDSHRLAGEERGSEEATHSRIKIGATNCGNSAILQRKGNAKFSACFLGSCKSFIIKGRGSSVVEQPIRNRQVAGSSPALGSILF